jgi:hypothetical protein
VRPVNVSVIDHKKETSLQDSADDAAGRTLTQLKKEEELNSIVSSFTILIS